MAKDYRKILGTQGEQLVLQKYEKGNFKLLEKNWRVRIGEIDLIFQKKDIVVFVEVKTASSDEFGRPIEKITPYKQKKLVQLIEFYLATHKISKKKRKIRVDAAEVFENSGIYDINIVENIIEL